MRGVQVKFKCTWEKRSAREWGKQDTKGERRRKGGWHLDMKASVLPGMREQGARVLQHTQGWQSHGHRSTSSDRWTLGCLPDWSFSSKRDMVAPSTILACFSFSNSPCFIPSLCGKAVQYTVVSTGSKDQQLHLNPSSPITSQRNSASYLDFSVWSVSSLENVSNKKTIS